MKENNKRYALILAGGKGSRLWPISITNKPKQYLNLYSNNIMINETFGDYMNIVNSICQKVRQWAEMDQNK